MSTCSADASPIFLPAMRLILSITQTSPVIVTTTFHTQIVGGVLVAVPSAHSYTTGLIVRFHIPEVCGMQQLNGYVSRIIVTGPTTFTVDIDGTRFDPFVIPVAPDPAWADTCAQILPIGEDNDMLTEATRNILP